MSTTTVVTEEPRYEYYYRDNSWDNKREILVGDKAVETFNEIPLVDVGRIFSEDVNDRCQVAQEIAQVCKTVGFMYITNHGIAQDLIDDIFETSRKYHAQSLEVKKREYIYNDEKLRGYDVHYTNTPNGPVSTCSGLIYPRHLIRSEELTNRRQSRKGLSCTVMIQITIPTRRVSHQSSVINV